MVTGCGAYAAGTANVVTVTFLRAIFDSALSVAANSQQSGPRCASWIARFSSALAWGFVVYAILLGLGSALQHMVQYLSFMSAENLGFIFGTRYFECILKKTAAFFIERNPAEIQVAGEKGRGALTILVQLALIAFIPGVMQIILTLVTLGALIDRQVVAIVVVYGAVTVTLTTRSTRRAGLPRCRRCSQPGECPLRRQSMNAMEMLRWVTASRWRLIRLRRLSSSSTASNSIDYFSAIRTNGSAEVILPVLEACMERDGSFSMRGIGEAAPPQPS